MYTLRVNGIIYRSRATWMEKGEKCTAHFLRLNQRNSARKNIMSLYTPNGTLLTSPQEILAEEVDYFKTYYALAPESPVGSNIELFFQNNYDQILSVDQQLSCEGNILEEELLDAINSFAPGKSPGIDGMPVEVELLLYTRNMIRHTERGHHHIVTEARPRGALQESCLYEALETTDTTLLRNPHSVQKYCTENQNSNWEYNKT